MGHDVTLPTLDRLGVDAPVDVDVTKVATRWFATFSKAAQENDVPVLMDLFTADGNWKDILALTWDLRTLIGRDAIARMLRARLGPTALTPRPWPDLLFLRLYFGFSTKVGQGMGIAYLVPLPRGDWKVYSLFTCLESLTEFPEKIGALRYSVPNHGTWAEDRGRELAFLNNDPTVVILGAGHTGLEIAARLKYLGVRTLVIEKTPRVGDAVQIVVPSRNDVVQSNPIFTVSPGNDLSGVPYCPTPTRFPCTWPTYMPALKFADWLESYAHFLELNVWTSSAITKTEWSTTSKTWSIYVSKGASEKRVLTARHLIFATGYGGHPKSPDVPDRGIFKGVAVHSANFTSAADYVGKKAVVVGACNSGHDLCQDFLNHGVDVTMYANRGYILCHVVRGATTGVNGRPATSFLKEQRACCLVDFKEGFPTDLADMNNASWPGLVARLLQQRKVAEVVATVDKNLYDGLAKAGFKTNLGPYHAGIVPLVFGRSGGYHLDTRTGKHIINGDIKLKQGSAIACFTESGLRFEDGDELEADVVVFATGYGDHRDVMRDICGPEVASKVGEIWGVDDDGQVMGAWRDSGHQGLWFGIGNISISRFHSAHLALQIKAIEEGVLDRSNVLF